MSNICVKNVTKRFMEEIENLCNNIFILDLGKEVASGSKSMIKSMTNISGTIKLVLENLDDEFLLKVKNIKGVNDCFVKDDIISIFIDEDSFKLEELLSLSVKENKTIKKFNSEEASLEEVFLSLTGKNLRD